MVSQANSMVCRIVRGLSVVFKNARMMCCMWFCMNDGVLGVYSSVIKHMADVL